MEARLVENDLRCRVRLPGFEGPLDLLLYLIRKEEIDIYDIPISRITKQYMTYLDMMVSLNLEVAGEYLYIASVLLNIKSRMLLPRSEQDHGELDDPRKQLTQLLVEYQRFRETGEFLREKFHRERLNFPLSGKILPASQTNVVAIPIDFMELIHTAWQILKMHNRTIQIPQKEKFNIAERMNFIEEKLSQRTRVCFIELFEKKHITSLLLIATFLALLELIHMRKVSVRQHSPFGNIWIYKSRIKEQA